MNYIREMNSFYNWLLYNPLPTGAIALWHSLMAINNKAGWADEFTVANIVLQGMTGLSRQGLDRARNTLVQKELILYKKGTSNQAGKYKIISLDCNKVGTVVVTQQDTEDSEKVLDCKIIGTEQDTRRTENDTQGGHNSSTLNKLNETKLNDINNNNTEQEKLDDKFIDKEFSELVKLYQNCIGQPNGLTADWVESLKNEFGFEWVKNAMLEAESQGVRTKAYVTRILSNWKAWGGMKLSTDKANNQNKGIPAAKKTRFHTAESRTDKYSNDQLEDAMTRKRREHVEKMNKQKGALQDRE